MGQFPWADPAAGHVSASEVRGCSYREDATGLGLSRREHISGFREHEPHSPTAYRTVKSARVHFHRDSNTYQVVASTLLVTNMVSVTIEWSRR